MNSAIAGLRAHQTKLDVTGNNIANVNTVGYKASQTVFEDTLSQVMRNGSAPTAQAGGTNPAQIGLGDRKSTRLNSSHANISYAVFCLKKKKTYLITHNTTY